MIGDIFEFNGKSYIIKRDVTFGEHRKIVKLQLDMKNASVENESEISNQFNQSMVDFLVSVLGLTEDEINNLTLLEAAELFGLAFLTSTIVKKNSGKISDLPSS